MKCEICGKNARVKDASYGLRGYVCKCGHRQFWRGEEPRSSGQGSLVELLLSHLSLRGIPDPVQEHRFHDTRLWRFDLAWPDQLLAVEVDGGTWIDGGGRHNRPVGMANDNEKINSAQLLGWKVLRFTSDQVRSQYAADQVASHLKGGTDGDD